MQPHPSSLNLRTNPLCPFLITWPICRRAKLIEPCPRSFHNGLSDRASVHILPVIGNVRVFVCMCQVVRSSSLKACQELSSLKEFLRIDSRLQLLRIILGRFALFPSKMAFFKRAWQKVKMLSHP